MTRSPNKKNTLLIKTPRWAKPLLKPYARYRGVYGGRSSGKSWFFAGLLVEDHYRHPGLFSVCVREIQKDLRYSAKRLIEIQIEKMGLGSLFVIQQNQIKAPGDGLIIFQGMQSHNAESIKSLESYDRAWIEEAQNISQRSLDLLRPTIRKDGSEIWASWNPRFEYDPIDKFLRSANAPDDSIVVEANYMDNPWLPGIMKKEMLWDREHDPDKYAHVWLGKYQVNSDSIVFRNWKIEEFETPDDAMFRFGADWGYANDPTCLVRSFVKGRNIYVDFEAYEIGCEIIDTPDLFLTIPGSDRWPIVADSARPETISHMRTHGFKKIYPAKKGKSSVEDGIEFLKSYDIIVHPRCRHVIDELTHYRWKVDDKTDKVLPILEDKHNHCIAEGQLVKCYRGDIPIEKVTTDDFVLTREGYKPVLFSGLMGIDRAVVKIKTKKGNNLLCTPDHEIFTKKGFVRADALRYGDEILSIESETKICFVRTIVNLRGAEKQVSITKKEHAHIAEKSLRSTNIINQNIVADHVLIVHEIQSKHCVWDLTVKDCHEFFANQILVSNCIDALRYSLEGERRKIKNELPKANPIPTKTFFN